MFYIFTPSQADHVNDMDDNLFSGGWNTHEMNPTVNNGAHHDYFSRDIIKLAE
jgi:hypothetical protein